MACKSSSHPSFINTQFTLLLFIFGSSIILVHSKSSYHYYKAELDKNDQHVFHVENLDGEIFSLKRDKRSLEPTSSTLLSSSSSYSSSPSSPLSPSSSPVSLSTLTLTSTSTSTSQISEHAPPVIKTETGPTSNVTYKTQNVNNSMESINVGTNSSAVATNSSADSTNSTSVSTSKIDLSKNGKNSSIIVSQPINPVKVWANQTRWANLSDENVTSKVNMTTAKIELNKTIDMSTVNNSTNSSDFDDITIDKFSDFNNKTLLQNNISKTEEDTHQYYNSTYSTDEKIGRSFWVDIDNHPNKKINDLLSQSHRQAATVKLTFDFPCYGHKVRNITIATGGFLYTGEYVHSWLAATQYIAPLMANFDTRLSKDSYVKYADNGTAFTVEWTKVVLQDKPKAGPFTFQVTLHENGNIIFVYAHIPLSLEAIEDKAHPVKVGLSDAYIMDRTIFLVRRKTIYEYHRVNFSKDIKNWTVISLRALPTCLQMTNCTDCLTKVPEFSCKWCPELNQCSTGTFRLRQEWLEKGCDQKSITEENSCPTSPKLIVEHATNQNNPRSTLNQELSSINQSHLSKDSIVSESSHSNVNMSVSGIIGVLLVISLITGLSGWAAYAYRNPHSASGQMLIRYRPSQWSWRRGEARYTAATIHM